MLSGTEATGGLHLPEAVAAEEEAAVEVRFARRERQLVDGELRPAPLAELALRLGAAGQILAEGVQCGEARLVFFPAFGHFPFVVPQPIDVASARKHLLGLKPPFRLLLAAFLAVFPVRAGEPPVGTFSIVAVDPATGEIGVAVQSRIVAVGGIVPFAKAGVGAVATQAYANVRYGPAGLALLAERIAPDECLRLLTASDPLRETRQAGIIDAAGRAATYTGNECLDWAGGLVGRHFAVQGNILAGREVVTAMAAAFEGSEGLLEDRLLAALEAGQAAGGDRRGMQSAALLVVREGWGYGGLNDRYRDLRVDEHADPIAELGRILQEHRRLFPRPEN